MGKIGLPGSGVDYIETCALIYRVERSEPYFTASKPLWDALDGERFRLVTSSLTLMEVLVKPLRMNDTELVRIYRDTLLGTAGLTCYPVSLPVLEAAASLRAAHNLKTPDAIHAATALTVGCIRFITNDPIFKRVPGLNVVVLSEVVAS